MSKFQLRNVNNAVLSTSNSALFLCVTPANGRALLWLPFMPSQSIPLQYQPLICIREQTLALLLSIYAGVALSLSRCQHHVALK